MAVWQGVNQGLRSGLAIADSIQQRKRQDQIDAERADERTYQRGRQEKADAASARAAQRAEGLDSMRLAEDNDKQIQTATLAAMQGGGHSIESRAKVDSLRAEGDKLRSSGRAKVLGYEERAAEARQTLDAIDKGADIASMPADKVADAFRYTFGHPTSAYLDTNGPSEIGKAYTEFSQGMESGDMNLMLAGAGTLLRPEIEHGVGTKNAKGETIVGKRPAGVYPSARDPKKGVMDLVVTAQKADGTTYDYPAWMTKGRGPAKGGDEHEFDIEPVLNRINAYGDLLGVIHDPVKGPLIQQKFVESQKAGGDEMWKALRAEYIGAGGEAKDFDALKGKRTHETKNRGGYDEDITYDESGNEISRQRVNRTAMPKDSDPAGDDLKRAQAEYYRSGRGGRGGAGGGGSSTGFLLVDKDGNEAEWTRGMPIPAGSEVIRVPGKPIGDSNQRTPKEILADLQKEHLAKIDAGGALGNAGPAPTLKDAMKIHASEKELFTEVDIPDDALAKLRGKPGAAPAKAAAPAPAPQRQAPPQSKPGLASVTPRQVPDAGGQNTRGFGKGPQLQQLQQQLTATSQAMNAPGIDPQMRAVLQKQQQAVIQQINQLQGY